MRTLSVGLVISSVLGIGFAAVAGEPTSQGAILLTESTTSVSLESKAPDPQSPLFSPEQLSSVSESVQARPKRKPENSIFPTNLMPDNAANTSLKQTVNPIDFLQVPPLDAGIKVNLSQN